VKCLARELSYNTRQKINFVMEVQDLIDALEENLKGLLKEPEETHSRMIRTPSGIGRH